MVQSLLHWVLSYLFPAVDGTEPEDPDTSVVDDQDPTEEPDDGSEDPDSTQEPDEEPQEKPLSRAQKAVIEARKRAQEAEEKYRSKERELDEERRNNQRGRDPSPDQRQFAEEEAKLRDPATSEVEKWQIQSNRTLRQSAQDARNARDAAQDLNDKTSYQQKAMDNPKMRKYADRVEEALRNIRGKGENASREALFYFLLGQDVSAGTVKADDKPKARAGSLPASARGKSVGARSDVNGKGPKSEAAKRRARLEGVNI